MSDSIQRQFLQYIQNKHLVQKGNKTLLAVSGGADSMLLCELFYQSGLTFGIAHCHFQLREKDADKDEIFVQKYAQEKNIPFYSIRFNTQKYAAENKISIEEAARNLRYEWFEKIRKENGYHFIATAHHKNDNAETLLFNLFRGTGIHGLHGIKPKNGSIIRPLLFLSKPDILNYFQENKLTFREDKTNKSSNYARNYIRNEVIPVVEKKFPNLINNLNNNIQRFSDAEELYEKAVQNECDQIVEKKGKETYIPIRKLLKSSPLATIAFEIFKRYDFNFEQTQQILQLANSTTGKVVYSKNYQLLKDRNRFIISPKASPNNTTIIIEKGENKIQTTSLHLSISIKNKAEYSISEVENIAALDNKKLDFPLVLRKWKQGDYFYPLGMRKKKKLSHFFIDQKLSLNQKEKVWILASGLKIVWIVGMRIDNRFKITDKTKEVLEIKVTLDEHKL